MAHRSFSGPPETFSPPFSFLCPWIHGLFPAIEFTVVPSPSLLNCGDPGATLARANLNSGDLTAAERSGAAHSRLFPWFDPLRPIQIERLRPRVPLRARAPDALSRLSAPPTAAHPSQSDFPRPILIERLEPPRTSSGPLGPPRPILIERLGPPRTPAAVHFPSGAGPARSTRSPPLSLTLPVPPVSAHPPARALSRRSNLGRWFQIRRLDSPDTPSRGSFLKKTLGLLEINPQSLVFACRPL
jgi:hypothetical protein